MIDHILNDLSMILGKNEINIPAQKEIIALVKRITEDYQDTIHRRNMQIKELKKRNGVFDREQIHRFVFKMIVRLGYKDNPTINWIDNLIGEVLKETDNR